MTGKKTLHILLVLYTALFLSGFFIVLTPAFHSDADPIGENCCCSGVTLTECNCSGDCHHGNESTSDYPVLESWPCTTVFNIAEMIQFPEYVSSPVTALPGEFTNDNSFTAIQLTFTTQFIPELPDKPPSSC
jgi:hypothetical protein